MPSERSTQARGLKVSERAVCVLPRPWPRRACHRWSLCGGVWSAPGHHAVHQETPSVLRVVGRLSCRVEHRRKTEPSTPHRRQELELRGVSLSVEAILLNIRPLLQPYTNLFEHLARRGSLVKIHVKSQYRECFIAASNARVYRMVDLKLAKPLLSQAYLLTHLLQSKLQAVANCRNGRHITVVTPT